MREEGEDATGGRRRERRGISSVVCLPAFPRPDAWSSSEPPLQDYRTHRIPPTFQLLSPSSPSFLNRHSHRVPSKHLLHHVAPRCGLPQIPQLGLSSCVCIKISSPDVEGSTLKEVEGFFGEENGDGFGFGDGGSSRGGRVRRC